MVRTVTEVIVPRPTLSEIGMICTVTEEIAPRPTPFFLMQLGGYSRHYGLGIMQLEGVGITCMQLLGGLAAVPQIRRTEAHRVKSERGS